MHILIFLAAFVHAGHTEPCTSCHTAKKMKATVWKHAAHDKKAPKTACTACHATPTADADDVSPQKSLCASCHDTTETCNQCHTAPLEVAITMPTARFSHEGHRGKLGDCASCHGLDRRGEATAPGHAACSGAGCHRDDFASTSPTTCAACHVADEPWRALVADAPPPPTTEFGSNMPHRTHAQLGLACSGCHAIADAERELRPPLGHASCSGDGCHGSTASGAAGEPTALTRCETCHRAGLVEARVQERLGAKWTVRARFTHTKHASACTDCHTTVWLVDGPPPPPEKATCGGCHDGKAAFKMTGHQCAKCHGTQLGATGVSLRTPDSVQPSSAMIRPRETVSHEGGVAYVRAGNGSAVSLVWSSTGVQVAPSSAKIATPITPTLRSPLVFAAYESPTAPNSNAATVVSDWRNPSITSTPYGSRM